MLAVPTEMSKVLIFFCAIMANCIRLLQVERYKVAEHFTVNIDTTADSAGRPQEGTSLRTVYDEV